MKSQPLHRPVRRRSTSTHVVDALESRCLLTTFNLVGTDLRIYGTDSNDTIRFFNDSGTLTLGTRTANGPWSYETFATPDVKSLRIYGNGGDDRIEVEVFLPTRIWGGIGNDSIQGGHVQDIISGDAGDDRIFGLAGDDIIYAGGWKDFVSGGHGNDRIYGTAGRNHLYGGPGDDVIIGGVHQDFVWGGLGDDVIRGHNGWDELEGEMGDDIISGGWGNDQIVGGEGSDRIFGDEGNDDIDGAEGNDFLHGMAGDDTIRGGLGSDQIYGGHGDDYAEGDLGDDLIYGGRGDDELHGGGGADELHGEDGRDLLDGGDGWDDLFGGDGNDRLFGGDQNDLLEGEAGNDQLFGEGGVDVLKGGSGNDGLFGGIADADQLDVGTGANYVMRPDGEVITGMDADDVTILFRNGERVIYSSYYPVHYVSAGTWSNVGIALMSPALHYIVDTTNSTRLLKQADGDPITFVARGYDYINSYHGGTEIQVAPASGTIYVYAYIYHYASDANHPLYRERIIPSKILGALSNLWRSESEVPGISSFYDISGWTQDSNNDWQFDASRPADWANSSAQNSPFSDYNYTFRAYMMGEDYVSTDATTSGGIASWVNGDPNPTGKIKAIADLLDGVINS